jgi:integral membrane protein (TIGR00529 family)
MDFPAIAKVLVVFSAMLLGTRLKIPLGMALVCGGVGLGFWAGHPAAQVAADMGVALRSPLMWLFLGVITLVVEIGRYYTEDRNAKTILGAVRRWGGRHGWMAGLMAVPSIIGLVPMPAGALFSAPFVEQASAHSARSPSWKTAVNYVFRHTWEFWWPLYPAVIVAMSVFGIPSWQFMLTLVSFTPFSLVVGYWLLVRRHRGELAVAVAATERPDRREGFLVTVLAVVIGGACVLPSLIKPLLPAMQPENLKMLAMLTGLVVALGMIAADEWRLPERRTFRKLGELKSLQTVATVAGVMVFKTMLDRSGLLPVAGRELVASGIPVAVTVAALPFLAGLVTGIGVGYTATSYPLVVGLMNVEGSGLTPMSTLVLASGFGYAGMMFSPVHLCLIMTRDYFSSSTAAVYRLVAPFLCAIMALAVLLYAVFGVLGW